MSRRLFDVQVSVDSKLQVPSQLQLDDGKLPKAVLQKFFEAGISIPDTAGVATETRRNLWSFEAIVDGRKRFFRIRYEPRYWDIYQERVEFRERVEHIWVYR